MIAGLNSSRRRAIRRWGFLAGMLMVLAVLSAFSSVSAQDGTRPRSPRYCRRCHEEAYAHWAESAHNLEAYQGERFQSVWERQRQDPECLTCHTTQLGEGENAVMYNGVTCGACHFEREEDYDPAERDHAVMSVPEDSRSCANCHGQDHALTYIEWEASPHNGAREVGCLECHDAHTGGLAQESLTMLCDSCHMQPVPSTSAHMHVESGCTDCHPEPIATDNVHMNGVDPAATCADCHMVTEMEEWGRYLENAGHSMTVPLAACVNCHGELHQMGSTSTEQE